MVINSITNTSIMNFLSIDCSTEPGSLFVKVKNKTFSKVLQSDKSNIDLLMKQILDFFKENNLKLDDLSDIFVNQGPGNFSGLRGSLATAKGISLSKNLNLFGYNTFILSCAKFFDKKDLIFGLIKFREKYFIKGFNKNLNSISEVKEIKERDLIKKYNKKLLVSPKNIVKNFDLNIRELSNLKIVNLDNNNLEFLKLKGLLNEGLIKPLYLG